MSYSTQNKEEITFNQKEHQQPQVGTDQRQIAPCLIWKKKNQGSLASSQSLILLRKSSWGNPKEITSLSFLGLTFNLFKNRVIPFTSSVWCTEWKEKDGWSNNAWTPIKWSYITIFVKTEILEEKLSLKIKCMLTVFRILQHLLNPLPIKDLKFTKDNQWNDS